MSQRKVVSVILILQLTFLTMPFVISSWPNGGAGMIWGSIVYHVHTHYHNEAATHIAVHMAITHILIYTLAGSGFGPVGAIVGFAIGLA